jgi:hypothetical protein
MKILLLSFLVITPVFALGCDRESSSTAQDESAVSARADARRARLERLSRINTLARLYIGRELRPDELVALGTRPEDTVIEALSKTPDFATRFGARVGDFHAGDGKASGSKPATSHASTPTAPLPMRSTATARSPIVSPSGLSGRTRRPSRRRSS